MNDEEINQILEVEPQNEAQVEQVHLNQDQDQIQFMLEIGMDLDSDDDIEIVSEIINPNRTDDANFQQAVENSQNETQNNRSLTRHQLEFVAHMDNSLSNPSQFLEIPQNIQKMINSKKSEHLTKIESPLACNICQVDFDYELDFLVALCTNPEGTCFFFS